MTVAAEAMRQRVAAKLQSRSDSDRGIPTDTRSDSSAITATSPSHGSVNSNSMPRTVPARPHRIPYAIRALIGSLFVIIYVIGLVSTVPGASDALKWMWPSSKSAVERYQQTLKCSKEEAPGSIAMPATSMTNTTAQPHAHSSTPLPRWWLVSYNGSGIDWTNWQTTLDPTFYSLPNWIDSCVPIFVGCIAVEMCIGWMKRRRRRQRLKRAAKQTNSTHQMGDGDGNAASNSDDDGDDETDPGYRLNDTLNSMSLGMLQQCLHVAWFIRALSYTPYIYIWEHYALIRLPLGVWSWLLALFFLEWGYYWMHRLGHEYNILWAAHVAHHSSESYNLSTALRQGAIQYSCGWIFHLPAAFFIPPPLYSFHAHLNRIYQFWIHTKTIGKMHPWIEYVLNTPSHHRVHHGASPDYLDCNFGGCLIIFDRLFGTFVPEGGHPSLSDSERRLRAGKVVYGLTHNIRSWNPLWANYHHWNYMMKTTNACQGTWWQRLGKRWAVLWEGPGWRAKDGGLYPLPVMDPLAKPYDRMNVKGALPLAYLLANFATCIPVLRFLVKIADVPSYSLLVTLLSLYLVLTVTLIGALMEGRWSLRTLLTMDVVRIIIAAYSMRWIAADKGWMNEETGLLLIACASCVMLICSYMVCSSVVRLAAEELRHKPSTTPPAKQSKQL